MILVLLQGGIHVYRGLEESENISFSSGHGVLVGTLFHSFVISLCLSVPPCLASPLGNSMPLVKLIKQAAAEI